MTFRNIRISLKITTLVLSLTILSVTAVSLAAMQMNATDEGSSVYLRLGTAICAFAVIISMIVSGWITRPLDAIHAVLRLVSRGELPEKTAQYSDEFGSIQKRVDDLVEMLKRNARFSQAVGEGRFDTPFRPAGENDSLGLALINMRDNLLTNDRKEKERNWIISGLAEAGNILRAHDSVENLGDHIIRFTIGKMSAVQGAFYTVKDGDIELRNAFAYGRKKYLKKTFRHGEGLVGQAVAERDRILRTEIPDDYVSITSGILGEKKPSCVLIVPLITNDQIHGAIELAAMHRFDQLQVDFISELSVMLARTIFNITVNERTKTLLAESQTMSADLKDKQEVLRQNAEAMQASQEELTRSNIKLEEQMEEVNRTRSRMQLLLENASEVISICEADGSIRYISPSVQTILGYTAEEMQGTTDLSRVHPDGVESYRNLYHQMKSQPGVKTSAQVQYRAKNGDYVWLEITGTNLLANPAIHGFILNSRDITERRRAEQEQRMRSKMQALSENSPDLITRLESGIISYINPAIETYTGRKASAFLQQDTRTAQLERSVWENWLRIAEEVKTSGATVSTEMDFPSKIGDRVMQVHAIPEFDEMQALESVLVVSHDVTDRKQIELDLQHKNKNINDSINYARRIQNAILPDAGLIANALPDSFILYKPRDVVSGDFPWFTRTNEDIFIAAVDCTGHGVPGALLSLIGYFLLNDIVRSRKILEPGKILDLLDQGVTETLRQDHGIAASKDGMDIALCRINLRSRTVEYAGAHRPLYAMQGGILNEVKGDRFPVGGGISKNQTNFTTSKISLRAGDGIYFSSDGFPDQFGGADQRKFGSKRLRDLIGELHSLPAAESGKAFEQAWEHWRGDQKQTDDMLLIGIKF